MDYTQPDPPASGEQPDSGAAPPYQPETGQGQPPAQQPYQPAGGYQGAPPPPPAKKGFNWLACCGISCAVLLIVGGLVGFCSYRMFQPFFSLGIEMAAMSTRVQETDLATIKAGAVAVTAAELAADPSLYKAQWLELEGEIATSSAFSGSSFSLGDFSSEDSTNYELVGNIVLMDVTGAPAVGTAGDEIVAYGQCFTWDLMEMEKMPFFGKALVEEIKNDPNMQGQTAYVMFMAKDVSLAGPTAYDGIDSSGAEEEGGQNGASGWQK